MSSPARVDTASRLVNAPAAVVYQAFVDPQAWVQWLPPAGMTAQVTHFDAREGGCYELTLTYAEGGHGKTSDSTDVSRGTFLELVPGKRLVQIVEFKSDDPQFAGHMRMSWVITPGNAACRVTFLAEDVPLGISPEDHQVGMNSTLVNLARYCEKSVTSGT